VRERLGTKITKKTPAYHFERKEDLSIDKKKKKTQREFWKNGDQKTDLQGHQRILYSLKDIIKSVFKVTCREKEHLGGVT